MEVAIRLFNAISEKVDIFELMRKYISFRRDRCTREITYHVGMSLTQQVNNDVAVTLGIARLGKQTASNVEGSKHMRRADEVEVRERHGDLLRQET